MRDVARDAVRARVADYALDLFVEHGFDNTTVDDIADAAGISPRSFFRYFATKEDVVIEDPVANGRTLADALAVRPAGEDPWDSMRVTLQALVAGGSDPESRRGLRTMRVVFGSATLRARNLEKHLTWAQMITPLAEQRFDGDPAERRFRAQTLIHGAFTCFDVALAEWVARDGATPLAELLDIAFDELHPPVPR